MCMCIRTVLFTGIGGDDLSAGLQDHTPLRLTTDQRIRYMQLW